MGYIDESGVYHAETAPMAELVPQKTSVWKQSDHDRQRRDHRRDLIRPYNYDGSPNEAFIEAYPEESKETYKFIPTDEQLAREK